MNLNTLRTFRHEVYGSFTRAGDALFNTLDALVTETAAQSFAELSLSPCFERHWSSLYEAFEDGRIERERLQAALLHALPLPAPGERLLWGIDTSNIARPEAKTSRDRTPLHVPNLPHSHGTALTVGWRFSTLVVLAPRASSWVYWVDSRRVSSAQTPGEVAAAQIREVAAQVPAGLHSTLLGDRAYPSVPVLLALAHAEMDGLLRCPCNRVFYRVAPPPTGKRGAPRKDGERFACHEPTTQGPPDERWDGTDETEHPITVECWQHLHLKQARALELSVLRVTCHDAPDTQRQPRVSWYIWLGRELLPLAEVRPTYRCRYGMEHGYRFRKQRLLWDEPRLRTPEQMERWTQIVGLASNHLVLARSLVQVHRLPWERATRPVTPQQVRRGMAPILALLGTPARPPKPRGKSPGRAKGATILPAQRYPVVKKPKPPPKTPRPSA